MQRFFDKINKTDSCWLWLAAKRGNSGYGCMKFYGKLVDAHRISYIIHYGKISNGMIVCHSCDKKLCVNPNHLFLGTQKDNMQDCLRKGRLKIPLGSRFANGHKALNSSLTNNDVVAIKKAIKNRGKKTLLSISKELGYKYQLLRDINCDRIYKNISANG